MKRAVAAIVLVGAIFTLAKVWTKTNRADIPLGTEALTTAATPTVDRFESLLRAHPSETDLVRRVVDRYEQTATAVNEAAGLRGLRLLDRLDLEAIYLLENHPQEFQTLADTLSDDAAADLLLHWREYFGLIRADDTDRARLISDIARLSEPNRRLAAQHPQALPLILAAFEETAALMRRLGSDRQARDEALQILDFVNLDKGRESLTRAIATIDAYPGLARDAFRLRGPEGFALVVLYGELLDGLGASMPLLDALIVLQVNSDDVDTLMQSRRATELSAHLRHVGAAGITPAVGSSIHGLRLSIDYGADGDRALATAGGDAADVVYDSYSDPALRRQAVRALGRYGTMAAAMLVKYADDADFQAILARDGAEIIPPIARADASPEALRRLQQKSQKSFTESLAETVLAWSGENGQATIRTIRSDGLARVAEINSTDVQFYQFLPLYDLLHLGKVMSVGHAPTSGELAWAAIDAAFVVWDVASLSAAQPAATAAGEAVRGELKSTARQVVKSGGREAAESALESTLPVASREGFHVASSAANRGARWWAVRTAGGMFSVLRHAPEALSKMSLEQVTRSAAPLWTKAGLRISIWAPMRFMKQGTSVIVRIPTERWAKYVGVNVAQAGLGVVAMHKMEEYLTSKRGNE